MPNEVELVTEPSARRARMIEEFQEARRRRQENADVVGPEPGVETAPPETPAPLFRRNVIDVRP